MGLFDFFLHKKKLLPPAQPFRERRLLPRWKIHCAARIQWEGQEESLACEVKDLNLKGLAITVSKKIPENCTKIILHFARGFIFNVEIALLWHKETQAQNTYGMKFTKIRDADKEKIYQMIRQDFPDQLADRN